MAYIDTNIKRQLLVFFNNLRDDRDAEAAQVFIDALTPKKPGRKVGWRKKVVLQPNKVLTPPL